MKRRSFIKYSGAAGVFILTTPAESIASNIQYLPAVLEENFNQPPFSVYPHTYWFWMNGNVTREGITLDLEAMQRAGVAGVFNYDVGTGIPKGPVEYLSEDWLELKKHTIREAARLGIAFTMHNCPGWSATGGPWITPELSMQQLTWSETYLAGGKDISKNLPPPTNRFNLYSDIAVVAFPSLEGEALLQTVKISTAKGQVDKEKLSANNQEGVVAELTNDNKTSWLQFEFERPYEARLISFYISIPGDGKPDKPLDFGERTFVVLEASHDGVEFFKVTPINTGLDTELQIGNKYIVYDIPVTKAKYFRITSSGIRRYKQVQFTGITRLKNWMEKTNLRGRTNVYVEEPSTIHSTNNQVVPAGSIVDPDALIDLTPLMQRDGLLRWNAPSGNWTIVRIGFTPMGTLNKAAPDTGIGLECDKFNSAAMRFHFNRMMEKILPVIEETKAKLGLSIDSYEAGGQNWTEGFEKKFHARWGYDLLKFLPALAGGRIVKSVDVTERFLWDVRRLQADMMAENYYGQFTALCHAHHITAYIEPYESGPMEEMQIGAHADVTLGEFWSSFSFAVPVKPGARRTPKLAASIAHINGQQVVGAEAFTAEAEASRWQEYPFYLKAVGDKAFANGINRMIIHRFAHQPHPTAAPGMTMGPWGIQFDRTNTLWEQSKGWLSYLARCQFLLQQGQAVADLLYFSGDDANMYTKTEPEDLHPTPVPGFDYDLINEEVFMKHLLVNNHQLVLPNGMSYRVFILQDYKAVPIELLLQLKKFVQEGLILVGTRPERSTGLSDYSKEDIKFKEIADELWGDKIVSDRKIGNGRVVSGHSLVSVLKTLDIYPDFDYESVSGDAPIIYTHRKFPGGEIYFLSNQRRTYEQIIASFRVKNKQPELWDAATGKIVAVGIYDVLSDRVKFPMQFAPYESMFVLFRSAAAANRYESIEKDGETILGSKKFLSAPSKPGASNSFTIFFWAKPEIDVLLNPVFTMGSLSQPWTEYYAIYPSSLKQLFGEGNACCGVTVGRNGVAVWESETEPVLVLPAAVPISGWTHIAVVYDDNVPVVFVDGKKIAEGKKSKFNVHVPGKTYLKDGASFYNGDMTEPIILKGAMKEEQIAILASEQLTLQNDPFVVELAIDKKPSVLIRKNGNYLLHRKEGSPFAFNISSLLKPIEITGSWKVNFPTGFGAPEQIVLQELISLHHHADPGVKYFSGTATYKKSFFVEKGRLMKNLQWFLDLGRVEVIAAVIINGKNFGTFWKRPYRINITEALKEGTNYLEINVTNQWVNRLIGDEQLPEPDQFTPGGGGSGLESLTKGGIERLPDWYVQGKPKPNDGRITFTTWKHFRKDSPLIEAGLIGPVRIESLFRKTLNL